MRTSKFDNMIGKVRSLIAKADDPAATPQEADLYRNKAEALMFEYKIDLATASPEERAAANMTKPEWREFDVARIGNEFAAHYSALFREIVRHVDSRMAYKYDFQTGMYVADVCGFSSDMEYIGLLWESVRLAFGKRMEPTFDLSADERDEAYRLRMGGMERRRIAMAMWGPEVGLTQSQFHTRNAKVTRLIKQGAERAGADAKTVLGRGNNIKTFRESYTAGFWYTLTGRLRNMAQSRGEVGKGLVLRSLKVAVEEEFYAKYPTLRPSESGRAEYIPPNQDCSRCQKAKSGYCREHNYLKPSNAAPKAKKTNWTAYDAGSDAARTVDLGPGGVAKAPAGETRKEIR